MRTTTELSQLFHKNDIDVFSVAAHLILLKPSEMKHRVGGSASWGTKN